MADYNINAVTRRVVYTGSAGLGPYAFSFEVLVNTDVAVYFNNTLLTLSTDYTVAISANGTGSVSVVTGTNVPTTPDADDQITIVGDRAIERTTDFVTAGDLRAASLNEQLDALTIFDQQLAESADRAVKAPITDPTSIDMTLPVKATRATKALGFDSDGDPVVSTLTLAAMEAGSTDAAASATAAATSATAAASSATAAASSATSAASSATSAASSAGTQSVDRFNGTGSQTAFTLSSAPSTENNTSVYISGVYQQKDTYAVSGTTLTFSAAPPSGTGNIEVMHLSTQSIGVDPSIGSVTTGAAGSSAAVSITSGGVLSFTIPQGDDGATGSTGSTGATGSAATVAVGSTTTGAAGSSAAVTNVGSSSAATLNFTVPKGDTGTTGNAATIAVGTVTTGAAGSSATIVNGGSSSAATFNFTIPRGDTGAAGAAATIAAGTATGLTVGSAPTVTNSGSSSAATFDFGIPVGATGATGSTGATGTAATIAVGSVTTGAPGSSATVTNVGSSSAATFDFAIPRGDTGSGDVTGPSSATDNAIARFDATTGKLLQNSAVTVSDAGAVAAGSLTLTTDLAVADGGTGSSTASAARTALGVDAAGTDNSTNVTLAGSLDYLTLSGQELTRGAIVLTTDVSGTLPIANGGTNATSAGAALTALGAAARGANSDITSLTGLTTDLTVAQGGTGAGTFAANGILFGNGTSAIGATAVGTDGHVLTSNGSGVAPTFQAAAGGGATDIDGLSDALTNSSGGTIGLGTGALAADDGSDNKNTALGFEALNDATTGFWNTSLGHQAGHKITTGAGSVALGRGSMGAVTTTNFNVAIGSRAMQNGTGSSNTFVGSSSGEGGVGDGGSNSALGAASLEKITTGSQNVAVGYSAGLNITGGDSNTMLGSAAGDAVTTGSNNTVIGQNAAASSATVSNEITLGDTSVDKFRIPGINFIIKDSTATEDYVLTVDASGEAGWEAAAAGGATDINGLSDAATSGNNALYLGNDAGNGNTSTNTGVGQLSLSSLNSGISGNTAVGQKAGYAITSGTNNTCVGRTAGDHVTTGAGNTLVGDDPAKNLTTGANNIVIGSDEVGENLSTGTSNTIIGPRAGKATATNAQCTIIGHSAEPSSNSVANEITLGSSSVGALRCQVTSITALSDRRDKKDIVPLELGLDFVNTLNPVRFTWDMRDGAKVGQQEAGFIAQELDEAQIAAGAESYLDIVLKENLDKLEATPGKLIPVLVKAIQDLSAEVAALKEQING